MLWYIVVCDVSSHLCLLGEDVKDSWASQGDVGRMFLPAGCFLDCLNLDDEHTPSREQRLQVGVGKSVAFI